MFKIKELYIQNFRSWKELHITDFDAKGLCGIIGTNGSGKSTIRQALEYLITDRTSDDLPLDELPHNKDAECKLELTILRDDDVVTITKYRNAKKKGNSIELSVNGDTSLTCKNRADTQKNIDELLKINSDLLAITTIFSQNSVSFTQAKESERKDILYNLVDLSKYQSFRANAVSETERIKKEIEKNTQELLHLDKSCIYLEGKIEDLEGKDRRFEQDRLEQLTSIQLKIKELKNSYKTIDVSKDIEDTKKQFVVIEKDKYQEAKKDLDKFKDDYKEIESEIKFLKRQKIDVGDGYCPVLKEVCDKLVSRKDKVIEDVSPKLERLEKFLEERANLIKNINSCIKSIEEDIDKNRDIERLIFNLERKKSDVDNHNNLINMKITNLGEKIEELSNIKENPFISMIESTKEELNTAKNNIIKIKEIIIELEEEKKYAEFWIEAFGKSGIPNMKIEGILESIETSTNSYLSKMNSNIHVEISSQKELKSGDVREKIGYQVFHPDKNITNYQSFSGGERQRIKVADLLTFNDLFGRFNILFLDEVLELSLDDAGKDSTLNLLKEKAKELGSIFVVSHDDSIKDKLDSYIKINKKGGVSHA